MARSAWTEFVTPYLREAGPTRTDKKEAMERASRDWHSRHEELEHRRNPDDEEEESIGAGALKVALGVGAALLGVSLLGNWVHKLCLNGQRQTAGGASVDNYWTRPYGG